MTLVTCTQAQLFPPLYVMQRFAVCDKVVLMQEAQYTIRGNHSRFKTHTENGKIPHYIPLSIEGRGRKPLESLFTESLYVHEFVAKVKNHYEKHPYFEQVYPNFLTWASWVTKFEPSLHRINKASIEMCFDLMEFNFQNKFEDSRRVVPIRPVIPADWILLLAQSVGAKNYLQGKLGIQNYFQKGMFKEHGITVYGQDIKTELPIANSVLDFLFSYGPQNTKTILESFAINCMIEMVDY